MIVCGKIYSLICIKLIWYNIIEACKTWILYPILIEFASTLINKPHRKPYCYIDKKLHELKMYIHLKKLCIISFIQISMDESHVAK